MKNLDKFKGCLVGGAAGDALGYPAEFLDEASILPATEKMGSQHMIAVTELRKFQMIRK